MNAPWSASLKYVSEKLNCSFNFIAQDSWENIYTEIIPWKFLLSSAPQKTFARAAAERRKENFLFTQSVKVNIIMHHHLKLHITIKFHCFFLFTIALKKTILKQFFWWIFISFITESFTWIISMYNFHLSHRISTSLLYEMCFMSF